MTAVPAGDIAVVLLAAGVGRRLGDTTPGPKVLLEFSGQTLLERHLRTLIPYAIEDIGLTVGYQSDAIGQEVARLGLEVRVRLIPNPDFRKGSLVSLSVQGDRLRGSRPVMLMDGDVLYDPAMIGRLLAAPGENPLMDRDIEPGDEPVKICLSGERIIDFRKKPEHAHDRHGESVGFFRFSAATAAALAERCWRHVAEGRSDLEYEEAIRDLILAEPERFAVADHRRHSVDRDRFQRRRDPRPRNNHAAIGALSVSSTVTWGLAEQHLPDRPDGPLPADLMVVFDATGCAMAPGFFVIEDVAGMSAYATAMVCVDPATVENGCLEVTDGCKRLDRLIAEEWRPIEAAEMGGISLRALPTQPGDVVFFDSYFPHASKDNLTGERRRMLFITYNLAECGDVRDRYLRDKRASYPPNIEREEGTEYRFRV